VNLLDLLEKKMINIKIHYYILSTIINLTVKGYILSFKTLKFYNFNSFYFTFNFENLLLL